MSAFPPSAVGDVGEEAEGRPPECRRWGRASMSSAHPQGTGDRGQRRKRNISVSVVTRLRARLGGGD